MASNRKIGRRTAALLWLVGISILIGVLIAYEQISILYVLATISIVALLLIVGFANLENVGREDGDTANRA